MLSRGRSARVLVVAGTTAAFLVPSVAHARPADTPTMAPSPGAEQAAVPTLGTLDPAGSSGSGLSDAGVILISGAALLGGTAVGFGAGRTSQRRTPSGLPDGEQVLTTR
jgi:hypothetical protein